MNPFMMFIIQYIFNSVSVNTTPLFRMSGKLKKFFWKILAYWCLCKILIGYLTFFLWIKNLQNYVYCLILDYVLFRKKYLAK